MNSVDVRKKMLLALECADQGTIAAVIRAAAAIKNRRLSSGVSAPLEPPALQVRRA